MMPLRPSPQPEPAFTHAIPHHVETVYTTSVVGFRGPLRNHMVQTTVVPLWRIGIFSQLCS
jgi:hypothetical protein